MESEDAISPVVGVMLMLVVTIIIAAVVSAFAGGLAENTEKTPQAAIDVKISTMGGGMGGAEANAEFKLLSGDAIPTKDLAIVTYYTNSTGYTYRHEQTATSEMTSLYSFGDYPARVPYLNDMRYGYAGGDGGGGNPAVDFGGFTWKVGDVMCTNGNAGTADLLGINDGAGGFAADADFGAGDVVDVKILHIPSGKYIYDQEVVVI
ncbi:type IV pilin N-terminal domain-containing protein [Methanoculleus sp.]|uniref:type IV pilin N-terminal domain-containing protein n=1 Tax=Methanoculleus sp. TaxID=90427 RepID=UPI001BD5D6E8|nr:type IV pilin N-terminal domain-containing protein [Methanoculleus sp.]